MCDEKATDKCCAAGPVDYHRKDPFPNQTVGGGIAGGLAGGLFTAPADDNWKHKSRDMVCSTCMWYLSKQTLHTINPPLGRCKRHAPSMSGYPVVYPNDWCGDHKMA